MVPFGIAPSQHAQPSLGYHASPQTSATRAGNTPAGLPPTWLKQLTNLAKQNVASLRRYLYLKWKHRHDKPLYEDIWRRPDGVCVNDEGQVWDQYWQNIVKGK